MPMSAIFVNAATVAFEQIERREAAGGGRVLAGAERQPGVDLERHRAFGHGLAVGRRVDEEAAGADRLEALLAHRHPIVLAEAVDLRRVPARQPRQHFQFVERRLALEISVEPPVVGLGRVGLVGDQHRRRIVVREQIVGFGQRFGLGARAMEGDAPAHCSPLELPVRQTCALLRSCRSCALQRRRHSCGSRRGRTAAACPSSAPSSRWPTGGASAGSRSGWRRSWRSRRERRRDRPDDRRSDNRRG